jgi:hypothetical protein
MWRKSFPFPNFENPSYFWSEKGGLGAALPEQLGFLNFTINQKGMGIAWVLIRKRVAWGQHFQNS